MTCSMVLGSGASLPSPSHPEEGDRAHTVDQGRSFPFSTSKNWPGKTLAFTSTFLK
jgi:hypothetical protein